MASLLSSASAHELRRLVEMNVRGDRFEIAGVCDAVGVSSFVA